MDSRDDITIEILREIRDDVRGAHARIDGTNQRIDRLDDRMERMEQRLDRRIDEVGRRIVEVELRTATAITDMHGTLREVRDLLVDRFDLRDRVERCERDIAELKQRAT
jgi:chromosome segregation ATPase